MTQVIHLTSKQELSKLFVISQIYATVPQFVLSEARSKNSVPFSPLQKLQCYISLTPLYLASKLSANNRMRHWIRHVMEHIVEARNMKIAKDVVETLRARLDTEYWTVYAVTGCYAFVA